MLVETTRFGALEVEECRLIRFPEGLIGFPGQQRFVLVSSGPQSAFLWLQSVEESAIAYPVVDPRLFVPDYNVIVRREDRDRLGADVDQPLQVFVIVNRTEQWLTGNLQGPLVINPANRTSIQLVLSDRRWQTRHLLVSLNQVRALSRTA